DGSMLDVLRIQMEKEEIKNQWENWQDRGGNLRESFNLLIGRDQGSSILLDSLVPPSPSTFKDSIDLSNHPEVNKWELESRAAAEALRAAKKDGAPSFAIGLDYVVIGERMDMDIPDNGKDAIMPMLSLSLPLWRKQYEGRETEAQQMAQFNLRKKEDALRILRSRESEILSNLEVYSREVSLYKGLMEKAQVALNLGMNSYSTGELAFEELMRIEQQWIRYREGWIKALVQWNIAEAEWRFLSTQSTIEDE
ncbi:MAG: TolC family protein, partial [Bacteroidota bacterium]|nr:TolC family protein [Bacteroidota bacterium]MDX5506272.1 TolC family protein [Bacteroidota bacterium]